MKLTFKQHLASSLLCTALFGFIVACGGANQSSLLSTTSNAFSNAQLAFKAVPGAGYPVKGRTDTVNMALFQAAPAASDTPQTFNGFCHLLPSGSDMSLYIYGLGNYFNSDCRQNPVTVLIPHGGSPVVDGGTLSNLIVTSKVPGSSVDSLKIEIMVNGQPTALGCSIGTGTRCRDKASRITVADGDDVAARITLKAADAVADVQVAFSKQ